MQGTNALKIAIWKDRATDLLADVLSDLEGTGVSGVASVPAAEALGLLISDEVDVAVLPSNMVFQEENSLDVIPGVAVSSEQHPYATVILPEGFTRMHAIVPEDPSPGLYGLLAAIVLQENYKFSVVRTPTGGATGSPVQADEQAQTVILGSQDHPNSDPAVLDLGGEWLELVNYPMVWALFVTRKGERTDKLNSAVLELIQAVEQKRLQWFESAELGEVVEHFYLRDLQYRLDDLSTASLTEFCDYLFYYGETTDVPSLSLAVDSVDDPAAELSDGNELPLSV